jgi:hypothetical protein
MEQVLGLTGEFNLPTLQVLARLLFVAAEAGSSLVYKTDVSSAFTTMRLSVEASMLQALQFGDFILMPLVSQFGWAATPAYYNVIAGAIGWAHNGGIDKAVLQRWLVEQQEAAGQEVGLSSLPDIAADQVETRSLTYVDDTFGPSTIESAVTDMTDIRTIIVKLLGSEAENVKKREGPSVRLTLMGWECDMSTLRMKPSETGRKKIIWWLFRGVTLENSEFKISLANLRKLVGVLRWYSAVIPFASTFALQALLTHKERQAAGVSRMLAKVKSIRGEALQELRHWRFVVGQSLRDDAYWSAPMWFLAKASSGEAEVEIWTDAATSLGGGYHIPLLDAEDGSAGHFGQVLWSEDERFLFGAADLKATDINVLEFVTAILAVVTERELLRGRVVRINVDNTAAISWLNKLRAKHVHGQVWVALLIYVMLEYNITIVCIHIAGVANITADALSRFLQECRERLLAEGYRQSTMPNTASRMAIWTACLDDCGPTQTLIQGWLTSQE